MIDEREILRRRDMREVFTFTIDPADAKDFDDALSYEQTADGGCQVGVHIADVTHYVKPGSKIDDMAYKRGTSVYLVNQVLPMLPEELCNDLCSLRPQEEKLTMSVVFTLDKEGRILKHKLCRTVICSNYRLNYDEAQEILEKHPQAPSKEGGVEKPAASGEEKSAELVQALLALNAIAKKFRQERLANGALAVEQDEMRFRLDEGGHPVEIYFEHPNEAHHLIEEWMLMANKTVARMVGAKPFVYRIHDKPDEEKLSDLRQFTKRMGDRVQPQVVELLTIRAMAKAVYSTNNIGHYGLAFDYYTHFTSPIRRYPDMMVHRLLDKYVLTGKGESVPKEVLEDMCEHLSEMEQLAQQSERDSIKEYQTMWMADHLGEELEGRVSGVTDFGLFVQLNESRCEGLVHISKICRGDYMEHDEKNYRLIAHKSGVTYTLGDEVRVRVVRADVEKSQIDFELVEDQK